MAKLLLSAALLVLLVSTSAGERQLKLIFPGATGTSCNALGSLKIVAKGLGRCSGVATASCKVHAEATAQIKAEISSLVANNDLCAVTEQAVAGAGKAVGVGIAKSFAQALIKVSCHGAQGFACGYAVTNAKAWAQAYARSISVAVAEANNLTVDALCDVKADAIADGIASAFAAVQANGCVKGTGTVESFSEAFAQGMVCVFADSWAEATARACGTTGTCTGSAAGTVKTTCASAITSGTEGNIVTTSDVNGPSGGVANSIFNSEASARIPPSCLDNSATFSCCFSQGCPAGWKQAPLPGTHRIFLEEQGAASCSCSF